MLHSPTGLVLDLVPHDQRNCDKREKDNQPSGHQDGFGLYRASNEHERCIMNMIAKISDHIQSFLKWSVASTTALAAMASVSSTTPASAGEYCRRDVTSQVVSCSFDSLEQCEWTSSGRGGDCFRDPSLPAAEKLAVVSGSHPPHLLSAKGAWPHHAAVDGAMTD